MIKQRQDPYKEKKGTAKTATWLVRLFILFVVVTLLLTALFVLYGAIRGAGLGGTALSGASPNLNLIEQLYLQNYLSSRTEALEQPIGQGSETVIFVIESGQRADQVAGNLATAGLLSDVELLTNYLRFYGLDAQLAAGSFRLDPQMTIPELAVALTQAQIVEVEIGFLAGWRIEEMAAYLAAIQPAEIDAKDFLALAYREKDLDLSGYDFLASLPAEASLEGFLFPDSYLIPTNSDATYLIHLMLARFDQQVTPTLRQLYGARQLSVYEAVTLASIVEREAVSVEEQPLIAGVFLNRLALNMLLQADATVQYAVADGNRNWWKSPLSAVDLTTDSPYNTYLYPALPPGPIASPSLSALEAVAEPAETTFLFFVADCVDEAAGRHLFSETYEEHLVNVARCR